MELGNRQVAKKKKKGKVKDFSFFFFSIRSFSVSSGILGFIGLVG